MAPVHLNAHDLPGSEFFVLQLPTEEWVGQVALELLLIGPDAGEKIWHAELDLTWVSDGTMPASNLIIHYTIPLEGGEGNWSITGADLGWGDGPGTYSAKIDTDALNGTVASPSMTLGLGDEGGGGLWGQFVNSTFTLELNDMGPVEPIPTASSWGILLLGLGMLTVGAIVFRGRRALTA
ncbi:MAG: hypothetical protein ACYTHJ_05240 [Planctomycetota bacterium]|jgi:hypothetical protein